MMRVITGVARGRRLETLPGEDVTRPTTESVKEAVFSMIQFEIEGKNVLDLFAGSGQLGIEALSRGAKKCTFVENNRQAYKVVEENVKHCKLEQGARIVMSDAYAFLSRRDSFDIAFLDPPYRQGLLEEVLPLVFENMKETGVVLCEHPVDEKIIEKYSNFSLDREYRYGKIKVSSFCYKENIE